MEDDVPLLIFCRFTLFSLFFPTSNDFRVRLGTFCVGQPMIDETKRSVTPAPKF